MPAETVPLAASIVISATAASRFVLRRRPTCYRGWQRPRLYDIRHCARRTQRLCSFTICKMMGFERQPNHDEPVLMRPGQSSLRAWPRRLAIALAALLVLALAGEVLLRAAPTVGGAQNMIRLQMHADPGHYVLDPEFGALSVPSRREVVETPDYTYTFRTDHAGFPNPEPWPSQVEVAVLGSSLLDGQGVGMDGQFTTLLERRLGGRRVLNLAIPGGGTGQQYLAYQRYAKPLHPKLVIAVLWVTWDINNSWHFEQWRRQDADPDYTHYRMTYAETHPNGRPAQLSPFERVARFARRELGRSYLLKAGYRRLTALLGGRRAIRERVTFANGDTLFLSVRDQERLAEGMERPGTADVEEIAFRPLEQLRTEVGADGNRLLVVLMPSKEELYGADAFPAILRPIQEVRAGLQARQLPVLDLYPAFRDLGRERPPFFRDDMHPNALGNQVIADALATWIADQEIFTAPSSTATVSAVAPTK